MNETFADILAVGGKTNSLGRANEVIDAVLQDKRLLEQLYTCLFHEDAWIRMRAADSLEKVCREHPDWLAPYVDRFAADLAQSTQPSILWHLAQMYGEIELSPKQKRFAIQWLQGQMATTQVDWIVAANSMKTLAQFAQDGSITKSELKALLTIQLQHKSHAIVKRAQKLLAELA